MRSKVNTIDDYISDFPKEVQPRLQEIRETIRKAAPRAEETISYAIPTFKLNGRNLVHFGAFKSHYSFFPTSSGINAFEKDLKPYVVSKGTVQFPYDKPLPKALITRIVKFRIKEEEDFIKQKKKK